MESRKSLYYLEKASKVIEVAIAIMLLVIVTIKIIEIVLALLGFQIVLVAMEFEKTLSTVLNLVIGVEFTKMLIRHTPESVIDVLLFAIARQMVVYHESTLDLLIGVAAISGLFAIKRYLSDVNVIKNIEEETG